MRAQARRSPLPLSRRDLGARARVPGAAARGEHRRAPRASGRRPAGRPPAGVRRAPRALRVAREAAARRRLHRRRAMGRHRQRRAARRADAPARRAAAHAGDDASDRGGGHERVPRRPARALARGDAEVRELTVGPLEPDDARRLALSLLGVRQTRRRGRPPRPSRASRGAARSWSRSSRGARARYHRVGARATPRRRPPPFTLEQMLGERVARLPDDARRLLEVVAIGGRPLPVATVGAAAERERVRDAARRASARAPLRARGTARRTRGRRGHPRPHARDHRRAARRRRPSARHHAELARVLESDARLGSRGPGVPPARRGRHGARRALRRARGRAGRRQAGVRAGGAALPAHDRDAVRRRAPELRRLHRRAAEASEWAGRAEKAARAYLAAAEGAPPLERVDLERLAAAQLIAAGRIDEGAAIFRRVLAAVGRTVPDSVLGTIFWVIVYRAVSVAGRAREAHERRAAPARGPRAARRPVRGDAGTGHRRPDLGDVRQGAVPGRRAARREPRSTSCTPRPSEAGTLASRGGVESKRERDALRDGADASPRRAGTPRATRSTRSRTASASTCGGSGGRRSRRSTSRASSWRRARRWNANANVFAVYALAYLGDLREVKARTALLLADAERRGDRYTAVNLRASHPIAAWLAADDVEGARRHIRESMTQWSKTRFLVQHWQAMLWESENRPLRRRRRARLGPPAARRPAAPAKPPPQRPAHSRAHELRDRAQRPRVARRARARGASAGASARCAGRSERSSEKACRGRRPSAPSWPRVRRRPTGDRAGAEDALRRAIGPRRSGGDVAARGRARAGSSGSLARRRRGRRDGAARPTRR